MPLTLSTNAFCASLAPRLVVGCTLALTLAACVPQRVLDYREAERTRLEADRTRQGEADAAASRRGFTARKSGNYGEALRLAQQSIEQGDLAAHFVLSAMYWHGQGVAQNFEQAIKHMRATPGESSLADTMQSAYECAMKRSTVPAFAGQRGALTLVNDGTCVSISLN